MGKTVIASIAVVAVYLLGTGSVAMAGPQVKQLSDLNCIGGQTVAFVDGVWVCADFPALTGLVRVQADFVADEGAVGNLYAIATQQVIASCPAGTKVVGGGYLHFYGGPTGVIRNNAPTIDSDGWIVDGTNFDGNPWRLSAVAMCADAD